MIKKEDLSKLKKGPYKAIASIAKMVAGEGAVLVKNDDVLPLKKGTSISIFGRTQMDYYKSGTGSGGLVNVDNVKNIAECLCECDDLSVNTELLNIYKNWVKENPFDNGKGWASEPWCQKEMPISEDVVLDAAEVSDAAIVIISRTAGEDKDNSATEGSFLLSYEEEDMIKKVCKLFDKVCVLLNVGNIISNEFAFKYNVGALLYIWHGGQYGAEVVPDILLGKVNPSGKLSDTIAVSIDDYPSTSNFGQPDRVFYQEDIYVGYRYFETFAKNKVIFPFGFGLSYTNFDINCVNAICRDDKIFVDVIVKNVGIYSGKEVVQIYYKAPNGKLGQPDRQLVRYKKTKLLSPCEEEIINISFNVTEMKSYDDSGITGNKSCYIMESGEFEIFVGNSSRHNELVYTYENKGLTVVEKLCEAMAPTKNFKRLKAQHTENGNKMFYEDVATRKIELNKRIADNLPNEISYTGDNGIKLYDVYNGKNTIEQFIAQLTPEQLICLTRGEGMNSPKVTPGTGSAFGGLSADLHSYGIPPVCTTDGPSGLRLDGGDKATSIPNGTLMACTFNDELITQLFEMLAVELYVYDIDALLGPGMNIHRNPLNGRNFEYFSEDPYLTGMMAIAVSKGISIYGASSVIKHFCCNSQEYKRYDVDAVVSERALREIYLKGFEIAVRSGYVRAIMTSYNPTNGIYTASNYDLNTTILRGEWGYEGLVMTDWWAKMNDEGETGTTENTKAMIRAQNDIYMVTGDAYSNSNNDNSKEAYDNGYITLGQLQSCARNILQFILKSPSFDKYVANGCKISKLDDINLNEKQLLITLDNVEKGNDYEIEISKASKYYVKITYVIETKSISQYVMTAYINNKNSASDTISSANGNEITVIKELNLIGLGKTTFRIEGSDAVDVKKVEIYN